ncbi:MAG TPA: alpha/beta hydrolase [Candidatus Methylacidiphilales bacterium]|nr:alpha/beta hydrolase [Candidatus Methylacidiphilales bacterium]
MATPFLTMAQTAAPVMPLPSATNAPAGEVSAAPRPPKAEYKTESDLFYYEGEAATKADEYQKEKCRLDLYYPTNRPGFATVIWLHGGGLSQGTRYFPALKEKEIALVGVSYRLSPKATIPAFFEDAAAATAWTLKNIEKYGGDPKKVFIAGHSAGGYLAALVAMDPRWLKAHGLSNMQLAGVIPVSGQVTTHFLVKKLNGDTGPEFRPVIDEYAPMHYAAKALPPICLITGDRRVEYKSRVEENEFLAISLKNLGHPMVEFYEMGGLTHSTIVEGSTILIRAFVKKVTTPAIGVPAAATPAPGSPQTAPAGP